MWRAIRHGLGGTQIDFPAGEVIETREALERLVQWTAPVRDQLGLDVEIPATNGADRMRSRLEEGLPLADVYREAVAETERSYAPELKAA